MNSRRALYFFVGSRRRQPALSDRLPALRGHQDVRVPRRGHRRDSRGRSFSHLAQHLHLNRVSAQEHAGRTRIQANSDPDGHLGEQRPLGVQAR